MFGWHFHNRQALKDWILLGIQWLATAISIGNPFDSLSPLEIFSRASNLGGWQYASSFESFTDVLKEESQSFLPAAISFGRDPC